MSNETKEITDIEFARRWQELKRILHGKVPEIADRAGTDVVRFMNATQRKIKSPELLGPMYEAMEQVAREELEKIKL